MPRYQSPSNTVNLGCDAVSCAVLGIDAESLKLPFLSSLRTAKAIERLVFVHVEIDLG